MFEGIETARDGYLGTLVLLYAILVFCITSHIPRVDANVIEY